MMKPLLAAALLCSFASAAQAGVSQRVNYHYFTVGGVNAGSIYNSVVNHSDLKGGRHTLATTDVTMDPKISTAKTGRCRATGFNVALTFDVNLPRLSNTANLSPGLRREWQGFVQHLMIHEAHHRTIWMGCAAAYSSALQSLVGSDCNGLSDKMNARWDKIEQTCRARNQAFDAAEGRRMRSQSFISRALGGR